MAYLDNKTLTKALCTVANPLVELILQFTGELITIIIKFQLSRVRAP